MGKNKLDADKLLSEYLKKLGAKGGKARAARHSHKQLSRWAKLGGRPKKGTGKVR